VAKLDEGVAADGELAQPIVAGHEDAPGVGERVRGPALTLGGGGRL